MSGDAAAKIGPAAWMRSMPDHSDGQSWRESRAQKPDAPDAPLYQAQAEKPARKKRSRLALVDPAPVFAVDSALKEITTSPAVALHRTAAHAWAARAVACYRVCLGKVDLQEGLSYLYLGEHYREAALAHAAMGEAWQPLFAEIDEAMSEDRARAFASMRGRSPVATR